VAVIEAVPKWGPEDVLAMDAMLAISLLAARRRRSAPAIRQSAFGNRQSAGGWVDRPGGGRELHITSMDELSSFLRRGL
jgi:hypothetical protein